MLTLKDKCFQRVGEEIEDAFPLPQVRKLGEKLLF